MQIGRKFLILAVVVVFSYIGSPYMGSIDKGIFGSGGTWIDVSAIFGLFSGFVFLLPCLFTAFGGKWKYWWIGVLLIPATVFEVYFDFAHIYFPILLGLVGWGIGWMVAKYIKTMVVPAKTE